MITLEFNNNCSIAWEGRSCNGRSVEGTSVGVIFYGETGSLLIDGNGYTIYDLGNKTIKEVKGKVVDSRNLSNPAEELDALHIQDFFSGIRNGTKQHFDITEGHKSTLLCQLGNIALRSGNSLRTNSSNGHIIDDPAAQKYWKRQYQPGWEPMI